MKLFAIFTVPDTPSSNHQQFKLDMSHVQQSTARTQHLISALQLFSLWI